MSWYRTGTVSVTSGSTAVTGSGTAWVGNVFPGDMFYGPNGVPYEVDEVVSNTSLVLVETYGGAPTVGAAYKIMPTQGRVRELTAQVLQLIADYGSVEAALTVLSGNVGLGKSPNTSAKLDVAGQVWVDAPSGDATVRLLTSSAEKGKLAATSAGRVYIESNGAEVMTWLNGNVGIGLSPVQRLTVYTPGAAAGYAQFTNGSTGPAAGNGLLVGVNAAGQGVINHQTNASLLLGANNATVLAIKETGNVGIGTLSPTSFGTGYSALSIDGSTCGVLDLMQAGASAFRLFCFPTEARLQVMLNAPMKFYTNNIVRGQFKAAGQLNLEPLSADPSGAGAGDLYFNGTTSKLRLHNGSGWVDLH